MWSFERQVINFLLNVWSSREPQIALSKGRGMTELGSGMLSETAVDDGEEKGEAERGC